MTVDNSRAGRLIWIDLEMTGLNPDTDSIIEMATVVTDAQLKTLAQGPVHVISHPLARLEVMDDWNRKQHQKSGLWQRVLDSNTTLEQAQADTLAFLQQWCAPNSSPMCGNSICQDRRFLYRQMPQLEAFFHYRNLDVSSLKELAKRWAPDIAADMEKRSAHTALSDVYESIEELAYYRQFMGQLSGLPQNRS